MTDLEKSIACALRLSEKATEKLLTQIQRHINTARLELIRVGVSTEVAESSHLLIEDAIITYCLMKMDSDSMQEKHENAWEYQKDSLRKSTLVIENEE